MFRGINAVTIDAKGRIAIPSRYRTLLMHHMVITIEPEEPCLLVYPTDEWQKIEAKLQMLPSFNASARRIQRLLIGHATDVELDGQGRILLPTLLREYAHITKQAVLIGQGNKFELWDETTWKAKRESWLAEPSTLDGNLPEDMQHFSL